MLCFGVNSFFSPTLNSLLVVCMARERGELAQFIALRASSANPLTTANVRQAPSAPMAVGKASLAPKHAQAPPALSQSHASTHAPTRAPAQASAAARHLFPMPVRKELYDATRDELDQTKHELAVARADVANLLRDLQTCENAVRVTRWLEAQASAGACNRFWRAFPPSASRWGRAREWRCRAPPLVSPVRARAFLAKQLQCS